MTVFILFKQPHNTVYLDTLSLLAFFGEMLNFISEQQLWQRQNKQLSKTKQNETKQNT